MFRSWGRISAAFCGAPVDSGGPRGLRAPRTDLGLRFVGRGRGSCCDANRGPHSELNPSGAAFPLDRTPRVGLLVVEAPFGGAVEDVVALQRPGADKQMRHISTIEVYVEFELVSFLLP